MRFSTSYHLLAFLGFVAVSVSADPLSDISYTSVDLDAARQSLRSDSPRFTLTVHRTDDLVDEDGGTLVAERQVEVQMSFDVSSTGDDNTLLLNGVPVVAGVSGVQVQVEAEMMINRDNVGLPDGTISREKEESVESAFDVGLVTIEVFVRAITLIIEPDPFLPPVLVRRFSLVERVIEINGESVVQTDVGEQIFYFGPGGDFIGVVEAAEWASISQKEETSLLALQSSSMDCRMARVRTSFNGWFKTLPSALKFMLGFAWAMIGMMWGILLTSRIVLLIRRVRQGYSRVDPENDAGTGYSDDVKESDAQSVSDGLPTYVSTESEE